MRCRWNGSYLGLFALTLALGACGNDGGSTAPTYTIGGAVTGLNGSGLVLQNNGGDNLTVSADGSFTFATALKNLSSYTVTVQTQPTNLSQTCSVTNGAGTLSAADVANVAISCTTNSFTIGGSINGLSGTGLVLQNNGGDNVNVAGATYEFSTALLDGSHYAVTVSTQPTGQSCNVANRLGTLAGTNITNATVTCRSWDSAALLELENNGSTITSIPQVAFDGSGNGLVVWHQYDGTRNNILFNRYTAGGGWGSAAPVETSSGDATDPQIAFYSNGDALAVWSQSDGIVNSIWASRYVAGVWDTAVKIETNDTQHAYFPQLGLDGSGNAIVVWQQNSGGVNSIWANRYAAGVWGIASLIETIDTGHAFSPQIAVDNAGNALAVWYQSNGSVFSTWANRYDVANTSWDGAILIEADDTGSTKAPQIAMDTNGNAIAIWQQFDGTSNNILINQYVVDTGWAASATAIENAVGDATSPQIAFDSSGNAIAVWQQSDGTRDNIWAKRYVNGTGWDAAAVMIESDDAGPAGDPQVAMNADGNAVVVWSQSNSSVYNIHANNYVAGTGWGVARLIETDTTEHALQPQVAIDTNGNALAVWYQNDMVQKNIWANRFQ